MKITSFSVLLVLLAGCSAPPPKIASLSGAASKENASGDSSSDTTAEGESDDSDHGSTNQAKVPSPQPTPPAPTVEPEIDPKAAFASLDGFRWEFICDKDPGSDELCDSKSAIDTNKTILGKPTDLYAVELRFRGLVEDTLYKDGSLSNDHFYTGGVIDNGPDPGFNIYAIEVSSPKQVYYLNAFPNLSHNLYVIDYSVKIQVNGGATIHLVGDGQNGREVSNHQKKTVPGVEPLNAYFNGQFVQMNVLGAELVK